MLSVGIRTLIPADFLWSRSGGRKHVRGMVPTGVRACYEGVIDPCWCCRFEDSLYLRMQVPYYDMTQSYKTSREVGQHGRPVWQDIFKDMTYHTI